VLVAGFWEFFAVRLLSCEVGHHDSTSFAETAVRPFEDFFERGWVAFIGTAEGVG
jgi:hypothetical protein